MHTEDQKMGCYKITKSRYKKQIWKEYSPETKWNRLKSIELEWDNLKTVINGVAYDVAGKRINTKNAGWFD